MYSNNFISHTMTMTEWLHPFPACEATMKIRRTRFNLKRCLRTLLSYCPLMCLSLQTCASSSPMSMHCSVCWKIDGLELFIYVSFYLLFIYVLFIYLIYLEIQPRVCQKIERVVKHKMVPPAAILQVALLLRKVKSPQPRSVSHIQDTEWPD